MDRSRLISAGLLDSGFASLATFGIGLYAARLLESDILGVYALFFSAFVMASALAGKLIFVPAEAWAVATLDDGREGLLRQTLRLLPLVMLISPVVTALAWLMAPEVTQDVVLGIALTCAACGMISPVQDHCRRTLHIASKSDQAAIVSMVQFLAAVVALYWLHARGVPRAWVPFGALTLANLASVTVAYGLSGFWRVADQVRVGLGELVEAGRWLVSATVVSRGADLIGSALIGGLGGAAALGFAEAARVVAQPVVVLGTGLSSVIGPRAMEAGARGERERANRIGQAFLAVIGLATALYLVVAAVPWNWNPLVRLVPNAFEVPGLVACTVVAGALSAASFVWGSELVAVGRSAWILPTDSVAAALRVGASISAGIMGAFAAPLGTGLSGLARLVGYCRCRKLHYSGATRLSTRAPTHATVYGGHEG